MRTAKATKRRFELDAGKGERVPAILQLPAAETLVPAVLLLHGLSSNKERMAESVGAALLKRNVATLAIDLPSHGARERNLEDMARQNPLAMVKLWRAAIRESELALRFLAERPEIDASRLAVAGYSLGAYLALFVAASNDTVRAVALAAGGDLPQGMPMERLVRAAADPRKAVRALDGRPLLMVNGRVDRTIRPEQATALYDAAHEPKELRWYDGGHWPPAQVIDDVAAWLRARLD